MLQTLTHSFLHLASFGAARNTSLFIIGAIFLIVCVVVGFAAEWNIFVKAKRPGWAALIPVYNTWVLFEISGRPGWWALFGIIPYFGWLTLLVLYIIAMPELARRFGKDTSFGIIWLVIFQIIGFVMLGFGEAEYKIPPPEQSFHAPTTE